MENSRPPATSLETTDTSSAEVKAIYKPVEHRSKVSKYTYFPSDRAHLCVIKSVLVQRDVGKVQSGAKRMNVV
jgi:hypothetical protein